MILYGLIGYPLFHSQSPEIFRTIFSINGLPGHDYRLFPIRSPELLHTMLRENPELSGFNVTLPFKESILPFLDELDPIARSIGAVNTVSVKRSAGGIRLKGYNTDAAGFEESVVLDGVTHALIIGTGGAAKAVAWVLEKYGVSYFFISRTKTGKMIIPFSECRKELIKQCTLIINATPAGMVPETASYPEIPYHFLDSRHLLYDLIYNPPDTVFMKKGRERKTRVMNGVRMLRNQAEESFRIWEEEAVSR